MVESQSLFRTEEDTGIFRNEATIKLDEYAKTYQNNDN